MLITRHTYAVLIIALVCMCSFPVYAVEENEVENNPSEEVTDSTEVLIDEEDADFWDPVFESVLDPDNHELERNTKEVLDKYSQNPIIRFFQKLFDALSRFLDKLFDLASEAAKIGE